MERKIAASNLDTLKQYMEGDNIDPKYIKNIEVTYEVPKNLYNKSDLIFDARSCGNTTRLVDYYIQELFDNFGKWVIIKDHYKSQMADRLLAQKILARLEFEHSSRGIDFECFRDVNDYKIKLKTSKR